MPRPCWRDGSRGFTLIEVMVVLVVIGIIVATVSITLGGNPRHDALTREAQRIVAVVGLASEEAVLEARELAVRFDMDGYRFLRLEQEGWVFLVDDDVLRERALPAGMELSLYLDDADLAEADPDGERPQVYILSSGELTPFEIRLRMADLDQHYRVSGDLMGRLEWEGPQE